MLALLLLADEEPAPEDEEEDDVAFEEVLLDVAELAEPPLKEAVMDEEPNSEAACAPNAHTPLTVHCRSPSAVVQNVSGIMHTTRICIQHRKHEIPWISMRLGGWVSSCVCGMQH